MTCLKSLLQGCAKVLRRCDKAIVSSDNTNAEPVGPKTIDGVQNEEQDSQPTVTPSQPEPPICEEIPLEYINLPSDISNELKKSIRLHKQLYDIEGEHAKTINTLSARYGYVKREIETLQADIAKFEAEGPEANENDNEIRKIDLAAMLREREELLDGRDEANDELNAKCKEFRSETFRLFALWHQILGDCDEDPEKEQEAMDPDAPQEDEVSPEEDEPAWPKPPSLQPDRPRAPATESSSGVTPPDREDLLDDYKRCWRELDSAEWCLANRHLRFDNDMACCHRMYLAKQSGCETKQDVEMRHLREWREITQRVIVAEEELEKVEQALVQAGIRPPGSEYGLGMVKEIEDEYRVSDEADDVEPGQDPRVEKWLKQVPDSMEEDDALLSAHEPAEQPVETDAWYAPEPEVWESLSMVAEGRQKKRINRWRAQAKAAAPRIEKVQSLAVPERAAPKSWKSKMWSSLIELAQMYPAVPLVF